MNPNNKSPSIYTICFSNWIQCSSTWMNKEYKFQHLRVIHWKCFWIHLKVTPTRSMFLELLMNCALAAFRVLLLLAWNSLDLIDNFERLIDDLWDCKQNRVLLQLPLQLVFYSSICSKFTSVKIYFGLRYLYFAFLLCFHFTSLYSRNPHQKPPFSCFAETPDCTSIHEFPSAFQAIHCKLLTGICKFNRNCNPNDTNELYSLTCKPLQGRLIPIGITTNSCNVEFETNTCYDAHIDCPGHGDYVKMPLHRLIVSLCDLTPPWHNSIGPIKIRFQLIKFEPRSEWLHDSQACQYLIGKAVSMIHHPAEMHICDRQQSLLIRDWTLIFLVKQSRVHYLNAIEHI